MAVNTTSHLLFSCASASICALALTISSCKVIFRREYLVVDVSDVKTQKCSPACNSAPCVLLPAIQLLHPLIVVNVGQIQRPGLCASSLAAVWLLAFASCNFLRQAGSLHLQGVPWRTGAGPSDDGRRGQLKRGKLALP